jgi:hypothetical protein
MKGFLAIIIIALAVSGAVSSHDRHEEEDMKDIMSAYSLGHDRGYEQGTYNPTDGVRSQIHNEGYILGQYWGTGQPIWMERNGWDKNDSLSRFADTDKVIVLAEISSWDICMAQGKKNCRADTVSYYKIISKHYTGWGEDGWNAPEFVLDWERIP